MDFVKLPLLTTEAAAVLAAAEAMAHIIEYGEYGDDISTKNGYIEDSRVIFRVIKAF
jgi:hypothetical protein